MDPNSQNPQGDSEAVKKLESDLEALTQKAKAEQNLPTEPITVPDEQPAVASPVVSTSYTTPVTSEPVNTQLPSTEVQPKPVKKSSPLMIVAVVLILLAVVAVVVYVFGSKLLTSKPVSTLTPVAAVTPSPDPTANWKTYADTNSGFEFKYPDNVNLNPSGKGSSNSSLNIQITQVNKIVDAPLGFDKATAIKDESSLASGNYGVSLGFSVPNSEKLFSVGNVFGKTYTQLQVLEICDVRFSRAAIIYNKGYQIVVYYNGPQSLVNLSPAYFSMDQTNCGGTPVWKDVNTFYKDVVSGNAPEAAQLWYNTFDKILSTFKFTDALVGDERSVVEKYVKAKVFDYGKSHGLTSENQILVRIDYLSNNLAAGGIGFTSDVEGAGEAWYAAKISGQWNMVLETQEPPTCEIMNRYGFPKSVYGECIEK